MQPAFALNAILGSVLIIGLIFANYVRKFNTDRFQRLVFCGLLIFTFVSMMSDFAWLLLEGLPGRTVYLLLYALGVVYYFFQVLAYYYILIFIDYMIFKNQKRADIISTVAHIISLIHAVILVLNLKYHFYFCVGEGDNLFYRGDKYYIRMLISYCPAIFAVYDFIVCRLVYKKTFWFMMLLILILPSVGASVDLAVGTLKLIWPCLTAALLYAYFFIIQSDTKLDILTGIGNRYSFNEFTDRLSRRGSGEAWAVVMIDMDNFKKINDKLGHQEGDNALRDMAAIIKSCIRGSDFAARYGGDEFVLATRMENGIETLMQKIQDAVDRYNLKQNHPFKLEISYGYGVYTADGNRNIDEFLTYIDNLMYKHKTERRRSSDREAGVEA